MTKAITLPLIGITISRSYDEIGSVRMSVPETYVQAIIKAGGVPFLIPQGLSEDAIQRLVTRIDGVLFAGGGDIHPERYSGAFSTLCKDVDIERDRLEIFLLRQIIQVPKPFFGICRGIQIINVGLGGTLYTDISTDKPIALEHRLSRREIFAHPVKLKATSLLAKVTDAEEFEVNSRHHQAIDTLAPGVKAVAFAPDGIIEGIELPSYSGLFGIGVQWHPEDLLEYKPARGLFRAFVQAAREFAY